MKNSVRIIRTIKTGAGHFEVNVYGDREFLGSFETNNASLVDDIYELENGNESELMCFETFEELKDFCVKEINK